MPHQSGCERQGGLASFKSSKLSRSRLCGLRCTSGGQPVGSQLARLCRQHDVPQGRMQREGHAGASRRSRRRGFVVEGTLDISLSSGRSLVFSFRVALGGFLTGTCLDRRLTCLSVACAVPCRSSGLGRCEVTPCMALFAAGLGAVLFSIVDFVICILAAKERIGPPPLVVL